MPVRRPVGVAAIKKEKLAKVRLRSPSGSKCILRHFMHSITFCRPNMLPNNPNWKKCNFLMYVSRLQLIPSAQRTLHFYIMVDVRIK